MARFETTRHVVADPAGVALLLAEPASWPDPDHSHQDWTIAPPRRVGSRFTAAVEVVSVGEPLASGLVTVKPSTVSGCDVRLVVSWFDDAVATDVERSALSFVELLAERAQARAMAA